nr:dephospho-CoA kinase [Propionibacterium sp.]
MSKRIALTGGIGSGKSTVADLLAARGAVIVDADLLAREAVAPGSPGLAAVVARFGRGVLAPDGTLDRAALGALVFADAAARADLNAIVHPRVRDLAARRRAEALAADPEAVVVHVIPLLVETGQADSFDTVVVVDCPVAVQVARVMARNGLSRPDAEARVAAQASRDQRLAVATHVIDNGGTPDELGPQVAALWAALAPAREGAAACGNQGSEPSGAA